MNLRKTVAVFKNDIVNHFNCLNCCKDINMPEFKHKEEYVKCNSCHYSYLISKIGKCIFISKVSVFSKKAKNQKENINSVLNSIRYSFMSVFGFSFVSLVICSLPRFSNGEWLLASLLSILSLAYLFIIILEYRLVRKGLTT